MWPSRAPAPIGSRLTTVSDSTSSTASSSVVSSVTIAWRPSGRNTVSCGFVSGPVSIVAAKTAGRDVEHDDALTGGFESVLGREREPAVGRYGDLVRPAAADRDARDLLARGQIEQRHAAGDILAVGDEQRALERLRLGEAGDAKRNAQGCGRAKTA